MARNTRVVVDYTDDMTGKPIDESDVEEGFRIGVDGTWFKLDTRKETANELRELLGRAIANGELEETPEQANAPKQRNSTKVAALNRRMRKWGMDNGYDLRDRGKLPQEVKDAYRKANPDEDMSVIGM